MGPGPIIFFRICSVLENPVNPDKSLAFILEVKALTGRAAVHHGCSQRRIGADQIILNFSLGDMSIWRKPLEVALVLVILAKKKGWT